MFVRKTKKQNGRVYLAIVQGYRDEKGKTKVRTVESLGYVDELSELYDDPIAHFEEECARRNAEAKAAEAPIIVKFTRGRRIDKRNEGRIELGACVPSAYFHRDLGIWDFFEKKRTARNFSYDPCRILELLVWNRISNPASKKAAFEARERFPRKCDFTLDDAYRSLTYLNEHAKTLVDHMNESLEHTRGPRNKTRLFYDVTNYYFEVENEDELRKRGVSKEHRPNPIVQMGLFLDGDGLPFNYEIFPGNANDMTTMLPAMKKAGLKGSGHKEGERIIVVADKGLNTSVNLAAITLDGNGFIFSQSVRKAEGKLKEWVLSDKGYKETESKNFKIKSRIAEKSVYVTGEDGKRHKVEIPVKEVAFWSRDYFERSRYERAKVIEKSTRAIECGEMASAAAKTSVRYAKDMPVVKETGEVANHNWVLDEQKIAADEACDGYYCIITSEQNMDDREIIEAYRGLWRIEDSFRVLKSDFDARPVYVSREDHIRAHFFICYLALLIMRLMQLDTGRKYTSAQIAEALKGIVGHRLDANAYLFDYRTDLTDKLGDVVGVDLSRQVLTKGQIRQIMADVRKPKEAQKILHP